MDDLPAFAAGFRTLKMTHQNRTAETFESFESIRDRMA
jgi:hypothetical protein